MSRDAILPKINRRHRYLIRGPDRELVSSTNNLGIILPPGYSLIDTIGVDGFGSVNGNRGIPAFLRAFARGECP